MRRPRATNAELTAATRTALISAGRRLFAAHGFEAVSADRLVDAVGLTRGALHHHFGDKAGLFTAVLEAEMFALKRRLAVAAAGARSPGEALRAGIHAYLDACAERRLRQVLLVDGPTVLGWHAWRALDLKHGLGLLRAALEAGMKAGDFAAQPPEVVSQLVCGAMIDAALSLARHPGRRRAVEAALWRLIERGLK